MRPKSDFLGRRAETAAWAHEGLCSVPTPPAGLLRTGCSRRSVGASQVAASDAAFPRRRRADPWRVQR